MKEFNSQDGGRYTFVDDVVNLQNLALAFSSIFRDCGNFVVWGCELSGDTVSEGFVFINGKLRQFPGGSCQADAQGQRYLIEHNTTETVPYASGESKVGRTDYGVSLVQTVPAVMDAVTGALPQSIVIKEDGSCRRVNEAFFGHFALLLNPVSERQVVDRNVHVAGTLSSLQKLFTNGPVEIASAKGAARLLYTGGVFVIAATVGGRDFRLEFSEDEGIRFKVDGELMLTVSGSTVTSHAPLRLDSMETGDILVKGSGICSVTVSDEGVVDINMFGPDKSDGYFRTTRIGDGKGKAMVTADGAAGTVTLNGPKIIFEHSELIIQSDAERSMTWKNATGTTKASVGFLPTSPGVFSIRNLQGNMSLAGAEYVDLGPVIREGGVQLSEKYVLTTKLAEELGKKADSVNTYSKTESDEKYAAKAGGFTQFFGSTPAPILRQQIGAVSSTELSAYAKNSELLSDMAKTAADKAAIRKNIGAVGTDDCQPKLNDTGWKRVGNTDLYARQIGDVVSIQGVLYTVHAGTAFTLPSGIESPRHNVGYSWSTSGNKAWGCQIQPNSRVAEVVMCDGSCDKYIPFTMTYMI